MSINFPEWLALMSRSIAPASTKVAFLAKTEFAQTAPAMLAMAAANKIVFGPPIQLSSGTIPMQASQPGKERAGFQARESGFRKIRAHSSCAQPKQCNRDRQEREMIKKNH